MALYFIFTGEQWGARLPPMPPPRQAAFVRSSVRSAIGIFRKGRNHARRDREREPIGNLLISANFAKRFAIPPQLGADAGEGRRAGSTRAIIELSHERRGGAGRGEGNVIRDNHRWPGRVAQARSRGSMCIDRNVDTCTCLGRQPINDSEQLI